MSTCRLPPVPCTGRTVPITAVLWSSGKQPVPSYYFLCSLTVRVYASQKVTGRCLNIYCQIWGKKGDVDCKLEIVAGKTTGFTLF